MRAGSGPSTIRPRKALPQPATAENTVSASCQRRMSAIDGVGRDERPSVRVISVPTRTNCSGSGYGSGRSMAASTTEKIAVDAPMPNARVRASTIDVPRWRNSRRMA